ncbi:STY0301 family protein [Legionella sp. km772]|uniref:STY0301 family protein n=1 Tax=Legionella sp. km772 TaxID=2498111 RepID=UPI000F8ED015|nr:STY0301 family protein [Legionella sp. km772]RUR08918.1 hypothetical protein ELY15_09950 [Legionella sp. km772]
MNKSIVLICGLGLMISLNLASAKTLKCPPGLKVNESLGESMPGWEEFLDNSNNEHHLNKITFYSGHPNEHASLAPDNENTKGRRLRWAFGEDKIWVACGYSNTNIQLIQKLDPHIKHCTVTYDANFTELKNVDCS